MLWFYCSSVFIISVAINGIKLPGPCPTVQPSTDLTNNTGADNYYVVYIVPFEEKESNVFQEVPNDYLLVLKDCDRLAIFLSNTQFRLYPRNLKLNPITVHGIVTQTPNSNEILIVTQVNYDNRSSVPCPNPLNETVTVWAHANDFVIVWSCHEVWVGKEKMHDAALIYGLHDSILPDYPSDNATFDQIVTNFRARAKTYFNDTLEALVKWPKQMPDYKAQKCPMAELSRCPKILKETSGYMIGIVVLSVVILIVLGILKDGVIKVIRNRNKIYPL